MLKRPEGHSRDTRERKAEMRSRHADTWYGSEGWRPLGRVRMGVGGRVMVVSIGEFALDAVLAVVFDCCCCCWDGMANAWIKVWCGFLLRQR